MLSDLAGMGFRKAKTDLQLDLVRYVKSNKKGFCRYTSSKRRTREQAGLLLNGRGELVRNDMEKAEVLNIFLSLY